MRTRLKKTLPAFMVTLPLVFVMVFFGYFPVHYDILLKVDNVVGEGICTSYGSQLDGRTMPNKTTFYFGSALKTATLRGTYYDVGGLNLDISDVSEFDLLEIDSYIRGIRLTHTDLGDLFEDGTVVEAPNYTPMRTRTYSFPLTLCRRGSGSPTGRPYWSRRYCSPCCLPSSWTAFPSCGSR